MILLFRWASVEWYRDAIEINQCMKGKGKNNGKNQYFIVWYCLEPKFGKSYSVATLLINDNFLSHIFFSHVWFMEFTMFAGVGEVGSEIPR